MKLYNTPDRKVEEFIPQNPKDIKIYTCGPTVYAEPHIGNWAAFIYWDVLVRTLRANNYNVRRTMNITDVGHLVSDEDDGEDKLEKGAKREGKTAWEIANFYTDSFIDGMKKLNLIMPENLSRATDFIPEQIEIIEDLEKKGLTYETSDGIYFDTSKFPRYADFAHINLDKLKAGARVNYNPEKRNLSDFALWKWSPDDKKRDMQWEFKGRMGFPGWHLECSAIAIKTLGETLDIHTGGIDHIPVHHTDEIAQSESFTGKKFSNYWLHANFITVEGHKISKSLNNGFTLNDLKKRGFSPLDYKMLTLQSHFQTESDFSWEALLSAQNRLKNWQKVAVMRFQTYNSKQNTDILPTKSAKNYLLEALNDNLDTPKIFARIDEIFTQILNSSKEKISQANLAELLEFIDDILGLNLSDLDDITDKQKQLLIAREYARSEKNWAKSDEIRDELAESGVAINDTPSGTFWNYL